VTTLDLAPVAPQNDRTDGARGNTECRGDFNMSFASIGPSSYFNDLAFREAILWCCGATNMRPTASLNDSSYIRISYTEHSGKLIITGTGRAPFPDFQNLRIRKLGSAVHGSFGMVQVAREHTATLRPHVKHVIPTCSLEHMPRIDARWIVAFMQQTALGPFSKCEKPSKAMSQARALAIPRDSVTSAVTSRIPNPTLIGSALIDARPKTGNDQIVHELTPRGPSLGRLAATRGSIGSEPTTVRAA